MSYDARTTFTRVNAFGLFTLMPVGAQPDQRGWKVLVLGREITDVLPYDEAHRIWRDLVDKAVCLDGNIRALALAWAHAAAAQDNLSATQARSTELIQEARATKRQLEAVREHLYTLKFAIEQGTTPMAIEEAITKALDLARP